jgi:hypothetical protein
MTVQTTSTEVVREVVREAIGHVAETRWWREGGRPYAEPEIVDVIADRVATQLAVRAHRADPAQSARIAELETGLREACDHIDDLHLLDLGLHAESVRLRAIAEKSS